MDISRFFSPEKQDAPFSSYEEYTRCLFACVDACLSSYIGSLMTLFAAEGGGFKNILYPDIEIARDLCEKHLADFSAGQSAGTAPKEDGKGEISDDLFDLFDEFSDDTAGSEEQEIPIEEMLDLVAHRASLTDEQQVPMPLWSLCRKLEFAPFTVFAFACAILSSTQTN